jgi:hypothetical protein
MPGSSQRLSGSHRLPVLQKGSKLMKRGAIRTEVLSLPPVAAAALSAVRPDNTQDDADTLVFPPTKGARLYITLDFDGFAPPPGCRRS